MKDGIRNLHGLNAEDFGDGKPGSETGLDAPESTITVTLKDNAGKYVLKLGKQVGNYRFAVKDGNATIFQVGPAVSDLSVTGVDRFQRPADAGAPKDSGASSAAAPHGMPPGMPGMPPGMGDPHGH